MTEKVYTEGDLDDWERSVGGLGPMLPSASDTHDAREASAMMCSAWGGWMDMPEQIDHIIRAAIEAGYIAALEAVRDGDIDGLGLVDDD